MLDLKHLNSFSEVNVITTEKLHWICVYQYQRYAASAGHFVGTSNLVDTRLPSEELCVLLLLVLCKLLKDILLKKTCLQE